jgi:hypothetical protein
MKNLLTVARQAPGLFDHASVANLTRRTDLPDPFNGSALLPCPSSRLNGLPQSFQTDAAHP